MAIFVDLADEHEPPQTQTHHGEWDGERAKLQLQQELLAAGNGSIHAPDIATVSGSEGMSAADLCMHENLNRNRMTEALGCYPIVTAVVSWLDLNSLDNLSRTCRQIRENLLQYRASLVTRTLHCYRDAPPLRADENELFWQPMRISENYRRKGSCARDMVDECRRCARPVCRNCVIRPPSSASFRDRHRRLCTPCTKAPLAALTRPPLLPNTPIDAAEMQRAICTCQRDTVWLCAACGRNIIGADRDYRCIWRWRTQYGEALGGTGIGEGNRGVICGREAACIGAREVEQQTDCDAEDAREQLSLQYSSQASTPSSSPPFSTGSAGSVDSESENRTPSPEAHPKRRPFGLAGLRPGYARHEIEGIGGVVKTKLVCMVPIGACVPEWEDEKHKEQILEREISGGRRSWCGWCWRVIPGARDLESKSTSVANYCR